MSPPPGTPSNPFGRSLQDGGVHAIQRARNFIGYVLYLKALHHFLNLRQSSATAASNRFAKCECLADHLEVRTAGATILQPGAGFCSAMRAIHNCRIVNSES